MRSFTFDVVDMMNADGGRVASVGEDEITLANRKMCERLASPLAFGFSKFEEITAQRRQAYAVVNSPQRPRLARFFHGSGVEGSDLESLGNRDRDAMLLKQLHAHGVQPIL